MAKIRMYKLKGETIKGEEIKSITRFDRATKENLLIKKQELLKQQGATSIKAKDVLISNSAKDNEINIEKSI